MSFTLTLTNFRTGEKFTRVFGEEYADHFELGRTRQLNLDGPYEAVDLDNIQKIMDANLDDVAIWDRLATNTNVEKPVSLIFNLTPKQEELMDEYVYDGKLSYLFMMGGLFLSLGCGGMAALIGQYLANKLRGLDAPEAGDLLDYPMSKRYYVKEGLDTKAKRDHYAANTPGLKDIIKAVRNLIPDSPLLRYYDEDGNMKEI